MIYITGDMHGDSRRLDAAARKLKKGDLLLVCGDFGFLWDESEREKKALAKLQKRKFDVAFVDGVHENFDLLAKMPEEDWNGGKVRRVGKNIFQLLRGELYTIEGKTFFAFGGGENDEKPLYQESGFWWKEEMPSLEEMEKGAKCLKNAGMQVDYLLTHMPPPGLGMHNGEREEAAAELYTFFTALARQVKYRRWYFGSIHQDRKYTAKHYALFEEIIPLED